MLRDAQLLLERRQQCSIVGELALGTQDVGPRNAARRERDPHQIQVVIVDSDDVVHRLDLRQDGGDGDCLSHRVRRECQVHRRKLIPLVFRQRSVLLYKSAVLSEQVRRVSEHGTNIEHARDQAVAAVRRRRAAMRMIVLESTLSGEIDLRVVGPTGRDHYLLRLRERSPSAREVRTVADRTRYYLVQLRRPEQLPPLMLDSSAVDKTLRGVWAAWRRQRDEHILVGSNCRRGWGFEIGPDGATERDEQQEPSAIRVDPHSRLLVAQCFDRIEMRCLAGWIEAEEDSNCGGKPEAASDRQGRHQDRPFGDMRDHLRDNDADKDPPTPPAALRRTASVRNCRSTCTRWAPIAIRMPISRVRSVTETSRMFKMPIPPTRSEMDATAARSNAMIRLLPSRA